MIKHPSKGATLIEYVLIASLIAVAAIGALKLAGNTYLAVYNRIKNAIVSN